MVFDIIMVLLIGGIIADYTTHDSSVADTTVKQIEQSHKVDKQEVKITHSDNSNISLQY